MKTSICLVICSLCMGFTLSDKTQYKAAVTDNKDVHYENLATIVKEASESNVDILLLTSLQTKEFSSIAPSYYDEALKSLSNAAKQGGFYLVAHMLEKIQCQNKYELLRNNVVFDRQGSIVSVYKKPVNQVGNCTTNSEAPSFTTDFGVTFGLLMEEDVVIQNPDNLKGLKNFIVTGAWSSDIPFFGASQFLSSWAYMSNSNLISSSGIYTSGTDPAETASTLTVAKLHKDGSKGRMSTLARNVNIQTFPNEDLSQCTVKPLDLQASVQGYKETVCHGKLCCKFDIKTNYIDSAQDVSYGLAAFDGVRYFGRGHNIGAQSCCIVACAGLYKRSCVFGSQSNNTEINFEKIVISGNFSTHKSAQFPVILASQDSVKNFKIDTSIVNEQREVTVELMDTQNVLSFGIFGRDFSKDYETIVIGTEWNTQGITAHIYEYFFNDDMQELFDYLWIRLRIMLFVVSIYVLEMM